MELPKEKIEPTSISPRSILIFGQAKVGKTTAVANLESNLILDFDDGTRSIKALKIHIKDFTQLREVLTEIKNQGKPYKYITVDTVSKLESMCEELALKMYQKTTMGKAYKGGILELPQGGGYYYLRKAVKIVLEEIGDSADRIILIGHLKDKFIEKEGKEFTVREVDLAGKLASIICAEVDATAYMYRDKNKAVLNFACGETLIAGSRQKHLFGKEIVISEEDEKGKITYYWDSIFID